MGWIGSSSCATCGNARSVFARPALRSTGWLTRSSVNDLDYAECLRTSSNGCRDLTFGHTSEESFCLVSWMSVWVVRQDAGEGRFETQFVVLRCHGRRLVLRFSEWFSVAFPFPRQDPRATHGARTIKLWAHR